MKYKKDTWYWVTDPREGDIWAPILIVNEDYFMLDGENLPIKNIECLLVFEAVMPEIN